MRKTMIRNLAFGWLALAIAFGLIALETHLAKPWTKITNGLWYLSIVALIYFTAKGFYYLWKHFNKEGQ